MNHSNAFNQLEHLLIQKSFDSLDTKEKSWVLTEMTEMDYKHQRQLIQSSSGLATEDLGNVPSVDSILSTIQPAPVVKPNSWKVIWENVFNHPIPIWQVALGCLFFGAVLIPMLNRPANEDQIPPPFAVIRDTISEHLIKPLHGDSGSDHTIAMGARIIDSNYHRYSEYIQERKNKELFMEHPLELTPIEFVPRVRKNKSGERKELEFLNHLN